ncbi:hypothetical protein O4J56_19340 [Nocardiopsis sp. RSe5-2]|uniref:Uncharacterized protein n=1 Tax=Nocardiopsis endophytica TaxID=3018445 RepID=A0ABT4U769_9ACTN|nr:hypothetical protein [Nocardiopsis endophytica]MDA2812808.1 hypothetical protein [Nocardiopsis endophytica]
MAIHRSTVLAAAGGAAVSAVATGAVLLPLGGAFADGGDGDPGECTSRTRTLPVAEAGDALETQGLTPAEGPIDGYEVGHVPDRVGDHPHDMDPGWYDGFDAEYYDEGDEVPEDAGAPEDYTSSMRVWLHDEVEVVTDLYDGGEETYADWDSDMEVQIDRSAEFTDADAYFSAMDLPKDDWFMEPAEELPDGGGYYSGSEAVFVPEPGVAVVVTLWPEGYSDSGDEEPQGDPEEVLKVVEGIEKAA